MIFKKIKDSYQEKTGVTFEISSEGSKQAILKTLGFVLSNNMDTDACEFDLEGAKFTPPFYRQKRGLYKGIVTIPCCKPLNTFNRMTRKSQEFIEDKILFPTFRFFEV